MGNNLAPILATIYMNELDNEILVRSNGCVMLKRFMDDYFAFLTSKELTSKRLLKTANGINDAIKFTLEVANNDQLPFLDTLVTFNSQNKTFSTILYMKPIHSKCITPWESLRANHRNNIRYIMRTRSRIMSPLFFATALLNPPY